MPPSPRPRAAAAGVALWFAFGASPSAHAAGFYIAEQSVSGLGRAFAGEATTGGDAAALWFNPALAADLDTAVAAGLSVIDISLSYDDRGSSREFAAAGGLTVPNGGPSGDDPISTIVVPNAHAVWALADGRTALGLSVNAPFGLEVEYPDDWFGRYDSIESTLTTINVQATIARRLGDWAAIGVGLDIQNADAELTNAVPNQLDPLTGAPPPDGLFRVAGDDMAIGWNAGALVEPAESFRIGISYRSSMDYVLKGEATFEGLLGPASALNMVQRAKTPLETPDITIIGAAYDVTDDLTLFGQATWFGWSSFRSIDVLGEISALSTPVGYSDTGNFGAGAEWRLSPRWTVRAGVQFDETPISTELRTTRVPDSDRRWHAAGVTWTADRWRVDAALAYLTYKDAELTRSDEFFAGTQGVIISTLDAGLSGDAIIAGVGLSARLGSGR